MSKAPEFKQIWEEGDTCFIQCLGAELKNLTGDKYYEKKKEKALQEGKAVPRPWSINFQFLVIKDGFGSTIKFFNASIYVPSSNKDFDIKSNLGKVAKAFKFEKELKEELPHYYIDSPEELAVLNKLCTNKWAKVLIAVKEDEDGHKYPRINTLIPGKESDKAEFTNQHQLYQERLKEMTIAKGEQAAKDLHG